MLAWSGFFPGPQPARGHPGWTIIFSEATVDSDLAEAVEALKAIFAKRKLPCTFGKTPQALVDELRKQYRVPPRYRNFLLAANPEKVETVTPGDYLGDVIGDINRRRGSILDQLERGTNIAVVATVPLSEMFGYIGHLRGMTSGRASYTMEFSHYDPVPRNVADEVIEAASKAKAALA